MDPTVRYAGGGVSPSTLSRVIGRSRTLRPVAWKMALAMAAGVPTMPISPRPLAPHRARLVVALVDEDHLDLLHVSVNRHVVLGEVVVHEAAERVVELGLLRQRRTQRHHHAAQDLTARRLGVDDAAGGHGR